MGVVVTIDLPGEGSPIWTVAGDPGNPLVDDINFFPIGPDLVLYLLHTGGSAAINFELIEFPDSVYGRAAPQAFFVNRDNDQPQNAIRVIGPLSLDGYESATPGHGEFRRTGGDPVSQVSAAVLRFT